MFLKHPVIDSNFFYASYIIWFEEEQKKKDRIKNVKKIKKN